MDAEARKQLVRELAGRFGARATREIGLIRSAAAARPAFIEAHLRQYILAKLLLPEDEEEDDITRLVEESIERTKRLDSGMLDELKTARTCNDLSDVATKKVMLLYRLRKDLGVNSEIRATTLTACRTVGDLAKVIAAVLARATIV